jgi:hypothetical protein
MLLFPSVFLVFGAKGEKKFNSIYLVSLAYLLLSDCNMRLSVWFV